MNDSRWYYGVALVMALDAIGFLLRGLATAGGFESGNSLAVGTGLFGTLLTLVSFLLLPVFCGCIYLDARATREAAESWDPDPRFWAVGALVLQIAAIAAGASLYILIGSTYMYKRLQSSSVAVADEGAWAEQEADWTNEGDDD